MANIDYLFLGSVGFLVTALILIVVRIIKLYIDENKARVHKDMLHAMAVGGKRDARNEREPIMVGGRRMPTARRRVRHDVDDDSGFMRNFMTENTDTFGTDGEEEASLTEVWNDKHIGKKKQAKLQAKEERRKQREAELLEKEERKKREREREERLRKEYEKREEEEKMECERKRLEKEEQEKREEDEYQKLRETFVIDEEGFDQVVGDESLNLLHDFIDYIRQAKVINVDELGSHFNLRTEEAIDRLKFLIANGTLTGVMDDRGKFIYITADELQAVAKFISQRGRVSRAELVEHSNKLISLESRPLKKTLMQVN